LVDLAADAGAEQVAAEPGADGRHRGGFADEVGVEFGVGGVARCVGEARGVVEPAVAGEAVEVREVLGVLVVCPGAGQQRVED
jgi:hypothetical protein